MDTQDSISSEIHEEVSDQVPCSEQELRDGTDKNWFEIANSAVLGFFVAIGEVLLGILIIIGLGYWIKEGYDKWFNMDGLVEVGECGFYYDAPNECFVKPRPHRRFLKGCLSLNFMKGDTIGVAQFESGEYRYINLNSASYINNKYYNIADRFRYGTALAIADDTIYRIAPNGNVISAEPSTWIYGSVVEINYMQEETDDDGESNYIEVNTGLYMYEDSNHNYGLMSSDFVRLTPPLFTDITPKSPEVFFCEYMDSGLGVLIDKNGQIVNKQSSK